MTHRLLVGVATASVAALASASLTFAGAFAPADAAVPRHLTPHNITLSRITRYTDTTGDVVVDSKGNGYVAWESTKNDSDGDPMDFCIIPKGSTCKHIQTLPLPTRANWNDYGLIQPFPVIGGKKGVLSVVATSYDHSDVVVWTSHDMGKKFGNPQVISSAHYDGTGTTDVLLTPDSDAPHYPDYFCISSTNPGLFYTFTGIGAIGARNPPAGFQQNTGSVSGGVNASTLGFGKTINPGPNQQTQTIEAFSTDASKPPIDYFWSPVPGVSGEPGSLEHGPFKVATGINPLLASGPSGLYLISEDYVASPSKSSTALHLDVRKWDGSSKKFGSPHLVTKIPNDINASNAGAISEDGATGALAIAWPVETKSGGYDMDVWTSSNGSSFSSPVDAGSTGGGYSGAWVATEHGSGFLTWWSDSGLELGDLG